MKMKIVVPDTLSPYEDDLKYFFETMAKKLHTNRHKGFTKDFELESLFRGLQDEVEELELSFFSDDQFKSAVEAVDVANFAFLIGMWCLEIERPEFVKQRKAMS